MILAVIEHNGSQVSEASLQMLTFARQFGEKRGDELVALLIGAQDIAVSAGALGKSGVARVVAAEESRLASYTPAGWAKTVSQVMNEKKPRFVMAAGTDRGNEILAHLAALAGLPMATNCCAISPDDPDSITRLRWGSSLLEEAMLRGETKLLTIAPYLVAAEEASTAVEPVVERFTPALTEDDLRVSLIRKEADVTAGITLKNAPVVIGGGRGVGSQEAYAQLEKLADALGGAVGCSRVATNNGWRPHSDQVGLTGTRIAPALYIACGISGAIQHLVGCKGAKKIMVINKDPEAAFFDKADYGILGDLHEVVPAILEELEKERRQP